MFKKRREKQYKLALQDLTQYQVTQQILLTLERMEDLLESIDDKIGHLHDNDRLQAEAIAKWVDHNTENLSAISATPDPYGK